MALDGVSFSSFDTDRSGRLDREEVSAAHRQGCIWARYHQNETLYNEAQDAFVKMVERGDAKEIKAYTNNLIDEIIADVTKYLPRGEKQKVTQYAHDLMVDYYANNKMKANPFLRREKAIERTEREVNKNYDLMSEEEENERYQMYYDVLKRVNNILPENERKTDEELQKMLPADISELPDFMWHILNNQNMSRKERVKSFVNYLFNK